MKNQRGLTLIEVLATITISSIVLAVGFLLFTSVNGLFNNTVQKTTDDKRINTVIDTISRELADPIAICYIESAIKSELRFQTFDHRYMALVYDQTAKSLSIAKSKSPDTIQDITAFAYETPKVLATNIMTDETNSGYAFAATGTGLSPNIALTAIDIKTVNLGITFQKTTFTPTGGKTTTYPKYKVNVSISSP
jgi:prepilin-type N-terminal cleavage/methylation domain-containing protein